jgi:hypothetical protein
MYFVQVMKPRILEETALLRSTGCSRPRMAPDTI